MPYCHSSSSFLFPLTPAVDVGTKAALISERRRAKADVTDVDLKATEASCSLDLFIYFFHQGVLFSEASVWEVMTLKELCLPSVALSDYT